MFIRRTFIAVLFLAALAFAQVSSGDAQVWKDFLTWFNAQPFTGPAELTKGYREALAAQGASETQVSQQLETIKKIAAQQPPELTGALFNKIYKSDHPVFSTKPNAFLAESIRGLRPGRALDVAMGQGRNTVFLAQQGWQVSGFDVSEQGIAVAQADAAKAGVKINVVLKSQQEFDFGQDQWDLVVMTYAWMPLDNLEFVKRVTASLKPGGLVLVEQFNAPPNVPGAKGPANALFKSFEGLRVLHYEDKETTSEWGPKTARIGRLLAEKI